jgi:hypothetical protein
MARWLFGLLIVVGASTIDTTPAHAVHPHEPVDRNVVFGADAPFAPLVYEGAVPDDRGLDPDAGSGSSPAGLIIGVGVVTLVFAFGLNAVRKQRESGRTTKFPRIG